METIISTIAGALIGGLLSYVAIRAQIRATQASVDAQIAEQKALAEASMRKSIAVTKAASFMERFSSPSYMEIRDTVEEFLASIRSLAPKEKREACAAICRRDTPERIRIYNRLHAFGMLFSEIGVSFFHGTLDADGLIIFDRIIPHYWIELSPFIEACHFEFGFPLHESDPLDEQELVIFGKFLFAYKEMVRLGYARKSTLLPAEAS
jgi:hypothetical protein